MAPWNAPKAKVQLRISVQRLRTLQQKKLQEAQAKSSRRDIASLLELRKDEKARIRVESLIHEDITIELLELLELYCELLLARFGLLDQSSAVPDASIHEAVCAIIYAAPRTELKELHILRDIVMHKYGREFSAAVMENKDGMVTDRIVKKLAINTPSTELVDAFLFEIAKGYSVNWTPPGFEETDDEETKDGSSGDPGASETVASPKEKDGGLKLPEIPPTESKDDLTKPAGKEKKTEEKKEKPAPPEDDFAALAKRFNDLKKR